MVILLGFNSLLLRGYMLYVILLIIALVIYFWILKKFKTPKLSSLVLVTGAVKSGKSFTVTAWGIKTYKRNLRMVKFINFFRRLFHAEELEIPLLYSNVKLNVPYVPLTKELILRKERFRYKSVCIIQEASLLADQNCYNVLDQVSKDKIMLFAKLFGHETKGGTCVMDTQCVEDLDKNLRKSLAQEFFIHHLVNIPLLPFCILYVRESIYSESGNSMVIQNKDVEDDLKKILVSKKYFKIYDTYTYSCFTDQLPVNDRVVYTVDDLKTRDIVSFRPILGLKEPKNIKLGVKKNEKEKSN